MPRFSLLAAAALVVVLGAFTFRASGTPTLPATPFNYAAIPLPAHLTVPPIQNADNTPAGNAITDAGATLGRVLFYDTRLSANETVSCATCHRQDHAFSDPDVLSTGFEGGLTGRHSMGLSFSRYYQRGRFFWDERAATLEQQVLLPIQDAVEMGMTLADVTDRLEATSFYADLFDDAFGSPEITPDRMARALAQFVRSMSTPDSRYDQARAAAPPGPPGQPMPGLTPQENQGLQLFFGRGQCAQCHVGDLFVGDEPRNNGLDATITDPGTGGGRFKVGSLRNVGLTAPYMHDGRFATLAQVVDHYDDGVQNSPTLDPRLRGPGGQPRRLNLTAAEKAALVAFLHTLTDPSVTTDERWSDPFLTPVSTAPGDPSAALTLDVVGPNPLRSATAFRVSGAGTQAVTVDVVSLTGRRVARLHSGTLGDAPVRWDASGVAAGLYTVRVQVGADVVSRRVTVVR